ncbi:uncharacterized protein L3040_001698 [Drepanopeziza brunnea f. sp. 'multigermtubi']|uniref:Uncharacterized protein n=1 Tax=Marssonina brunnea f. sp. multigermtubi (strain MB_m1) TaxID=1072389 RepID=K1XRV4_MARBU|nr:uncharacterized protein MBM_06545 [Drepanopeziza brunnea f. sp. 'multigermtubi' MB_m1]EKD15329.1 hypothetical protein MBM_06545 [Drepanopeziza brunnea f. sp. 'multigermtubi' MB_m1]KAJ5051936.1 hypothetical protein L3040_001698 [Drepanopeziza brunnea f. sp. 'multigermtubi']
MSATTMANSSSAMPGAFDFHTAPAPPRLSGAKSHIFQPPRTPSASASSSLIMTRSTSSVMSISSVGDRPTRPTQRKRTREEYSGLETPRTGYSGGGEDWDNVREEGGCMPGSPRPFVNTRYALAGGLDTPSAAQQAAEMASQNQYADAGYRKSLGDSKLPSLNSRGEVWGEQEGGGLDYFGREVNGRPRYGQKHSDSSGGEGWSRAAFQVAGAVVGKAWEFCKSSAAVFRGFQAGGGTRYNIGANDVLEAMEPSIWEEKDGWIEGDGQKESTLLPGQFPREELEFFPNYMDDPSMETERTPPRPAKRRQISANQESAVSGKEDLAKNWIMVPETVNTPSRLPAPSPQRQSRFSMSTTSSAPRRSLANTSYLRPASRAGFSNTTHTARRSGLPTFFNSRGSHAGSPALRPGSGASYASPRSPAHSSSKIPRATGSCSPVRNNSATPILESPAAREAKRWAAVKQRENREADDSIRRLDAQLKAMIREGKEALGTKVSVEMDDSEGEGLDGGTSARRRGGVNRGGGSGGGRWGV